MIRFIKLYENVSRDKGLTLKIEKSTYREWEVKVHELGSDRPFIELRGEFEEVFDLAYKGLYLYMRYGKKS